MITGALKERGIEMPYKVYRLTLMEVVFIIGIMLILGLMMVPCINRRRDTMGERMMCTNNLKQLGLSCRMYSNVYEEAFPYKNGRNGLQMLAELGFLENPLVYECPSTEDDVEDSSMISASSSYCYAGGLTEASSVDSALAADRANNHNKYGNILFVDGHVKGYAGATWSSISGGSVFVDF